MGPSVDTAAETDVGIEEEIKFQQDVGAAPLQRKVGFFGLALVGVASCWGVPRGVRIHWGPVTWCLILGLVWAACSYQWSADRTETTRELIRLFTYAFVGAALARRFDPKQLCVILVVSLAASAGTAVAMEVGSANFRPWDLNYRMGGTVHTNVLGRLAVLVAIAGLAYQRDPKIKYMCRVMVVAAIAVLILTKSRTGLATMVGGFAALRLVSSSVAQAVFAGVRLAGRRRRRALAVDLRRHMDATPDRGRHDSGAWRGRHLAHRPLAALAVDLERVPRPKRDGIWLRCVLVAGKD